MTVFGKLFCILFIVFSFDTLLAQPLKKDSIAYSPPKRGETLLDIFDVAGMILGKRTTKEDTLSPHVYLHEDTVMTNIFSFLPSMTYTPPTNWAFGGIVNASFFTGKAKTSNLSIVNLFATYTLNHQFIAVIRSTVWLKENKFNLVGDWRYFKYPSYTYGLGANTPDANKELIDYSYIRVYQNALKRMFYGFYMGIGYNLDYHFNIDDISNGKMTDFQTYSGNEKYASISSGMTLNMLYDTRKNPNNPVPGGHYAYISYRANSTVLGSDKNWNSLLMDLRKYIPFPRNSSNVLAIWSYNWFTFGGNSPYLDLPSSAWDTYDNVGRGYVQGRFRSRNLMDLETEYRFSLSKNRLFGGVVFANVQTESEWQTNKFDVLHPATGVGLRIKVNKHTNTNLAIDYGIGLNGSQGFFFNLAEVF